MRGALFCRLPPCGGATRTLGWNACPSLRTRARPLSTLPPTRAAAASTPSSRDDATVVSPTSTATLDCEHFARCPGCVLDTRLDTPPVWEEGRRFFSSAHQLPHFNLHTGACPAHHHCVYRDWHTSGTLRLERACAQTPPESAQLVAQWVLHTHTTRGHLSICTHTQRNWPGLEPPHLSSRAVENLMVAKPRRERREELEEGHTYLYSVVDRCRVIGESVC